MVTDFFPLRNSIFLFTRALSLSFGSFFSLLENKPVCLSLPTLITLGSYWECSCEGGRLAGLVLPKQCEKNEVAVSVVNLQRAYRSSALEPRSQDTMLNVNHTKIIFPPLKKIYTSFFFFCSIFQYFHFKVSKILWRWRLYRGRVLYGKGCYCCIKFVP